MTHMRILLSCILVFLLAAPSAVGSIERIVTHSGNGLDITLNVKDLPIGGVVETLPDGCTWMDTDHPADRTRVSGQKIAFAVIGEETIRYRVQGPSKDAGMFAGMWEAYDTLAGASGSVGSDELQSPVSKATTIGQKSPASLTAASEEVPCDRDGDGTLTVQELAMAILDSLDARFMGGSADAASPVDLQDAAFVYIHWNGQALKITDSSSVTASVSRPLRRIVLLNSFSPKAMLLLDVEPERVAGVCHGVFEDPVFYPEYQEKPDVGTLSSPNYEQIVMVSPDAVILQTGSNSSDEAEKKIAPMDPGIHLFRFHCYKPETYVEEMQKLGLLLGKEKEADKFLSFYENVQDTVAKVVKKLPDQGRVSVELEFADYKVAGGDRTIGSYQGMIESAGGRNVFADNPVSFSTVDPESIIVRNPDVIIYQVGSAAGGGSSYSDDKPLSTFESVHRSIINRPGWEKINAVRNGRVHIIDRSIFTGTKFIGVAYMAKWLYPDLFPDLDPRAIHQQYLTEFMRLDYDLDKHPEFVYPA